MYLIILLVSTFIRKIRGKVNEVFRYFLLYIPFYIPLIFIYKSIAIEMNNLIYGIIILILSLAILFYIEKDELSIMLDKEMIALLEPINKESFYFIAFETYCSAISEEIFYRLFILLLLYNDLGVWSVLLSSVLFLLQHTTNEHAKEEFNKKSYLLQGILSVSSCFLTIITKNIVLSIIMHLIFNTPTIIYNYKLLKNSYKEVPYGSGD